MFKRKTENYELPQWEFNDHPDFLNDMNPAYATIDKVLGETEARSKDSEQRLLTALPILEQNSEDLERVQHDITDLQVRVANEEHDIGEHSTRIQSLEYVQEDINQTLSGFNKNNTVKKTTDALAVAIENVRAVDYSTAEVDTGKKWIDSKNVYQIVLHTQILGASVTAGEEYVATIPAPTGIANVIFINGTLLIAVGEVQTTIPANVYINNGRYIKASSVKFTDGEMQIPILIGQQIFDTCDVTIIMEYTKG